MKKITQIGLIDGEIIANNCFSKFDWTLFYISKLVGTIVQGQAILLEYCHTPSLARGTEKMIIC